MKVESKFERIVQFLRESKRVLFITGAGISVDSGLPSYRGKNGLFEGKRTEEGFEIETVISGEMLEVMPEMTWKYHLPMAKAVLEKSPNSGHIALAEIERAFAENGGRMWILTQNIDGYHSMAGSQNVLEIHGNVRDIRCMKCEWRCGELDPENLLAICETLPPKCPECGSIVRPGVVLFGETLPLDTLWKYQKELKKGFDLYFVIGTSALFSYIVHPIIDAKKNGTPTVQINPGKNDLNDYVDIQLDIGATEAIREISVRYTDILQQFPDWD